MNLTYFTHDELKCPATKVVRLAPLFGEKLDQLRHQFGKPMVPTSCCRSKKYNERIKGHPRSLHIFDEPYHQSYGTCAIDIAMTDSVDRAELVKLALQSGWTVGVASNFLHLDLRTDCTGLKRVLYHYTR